MVYERSNEKEAPLGSRSEPAEELPYCVELRDAANRDAVERVLARAYNSALARAIFKAAQAEHPDRLITLRRGSEIIDAGPTG